MNGRPLALVGHCGPDKRMLATALRRFEPHSTIEDVNDQPSLKQAIERDAVLLVNRVLDGDFGSEIGERGIELIRTLAATASPPPMLLISNFPDVQRHAEEVGAMPGFGKAHLYDASTAERLRAAVSRPRPASSQ